MRAKHLLEAVVLAIAAAALNLLDPVDPGLRAATVNPYLLVAFAVAAYRGWLPGFVALVAGAAMAFLAFGVVLDDLFPNTFPPVDPASFDPRVHHRIGTLALSAILGVTLFGLIHYIWHKRTRRLQEQSTALDRERSMLETQRSALLAATSELERRVAGQRDSLSYLHARWHELSSQSVETTLRVILDTVHELTGAERCSLWQHDPAADELLVRTTVGWADDDSATRRLPVNSSIEGWVLRNGRLFSIKHLARYDTLQRVDRGTTIYSLPLRAGIRQWGVINVENLPFERFNAHTEHLLLLVAAVAAAPLAQAIAFEAGQEPADRSADTGYPLYEQLARVLQTEVTARAIDGGSLSVILIQLSDYHHLVSAGGLERTSRVIESIFSAAQKIADGGVRCFHYKNDGQLAVICPDLDFDGAALFALDLLRWAAETSSPDASGVRAEIMVGYSSLASGVDDADALLRMAENLLAMQR